MTDINKENAAPESPFMDDHGDAVAEGGIHLGSAQMNTTPDSVVLETVLPRPEKAIVFFIGGAADEETYYFYGPTHLIQYAKIYLDGKGKTLKGKGLYESFDRSYSEIFYASDIKKEIIANIPAKTTPVYIIGHSLGAWNGAHLSRTLADAGYNIAMLVTLDPVGEGLLVTMGSAIFFNPQPNPKAKLWINVHATPKYPDPSDGIANFGGRWVIKSGPDINVDIDANHGNTIALFLAKVSDGYTVADIVGMSMDAWTSTGDS
jgi:pimeloyl-ACP methyl ester carboxylesterase